MQKTLSYSYRKTIKSIATDVPHVLKMLKVRGFPRFLMSAVAPISEMPSVLDEASLSCCGSLALGFLADITVE